MSTIDYPDYFKSCAERIRGACASPPAKRRFRAMLGEYLGERDRQTAARDAWERRRREYLDNPGGSAPGEGWENAPPAPTLLALAAEGPDWDGECPADRALLLHEKYTICAGIHDLVYSKLDRLGPQDRPEDRSAETFKAAVIWEVVLREVAQLRDDDQVRVEAITKDVVADLGGECKEPARHSPDFRRVHWFGINYDFTATQAAIVKMLWEAWENRTPDVGGETLLDTGGSDCGRLIDVFRHHPSWKKMIVSGQTKGSFRLNDPTKI